MSTSPKIANDIQIPENTNMDESLMPNTEKDRTVGPVSYMFMWAGDGTNMGNMTLGASIVIAGTATLNLFQSLAAAIVSILIISSLFVLNDRLGYKEGIPYVVQLRMSFGFKGTVISALLRAVPAVIWYGVQSWIGGTALNEILKVVTSGSFDNIFICFVVLQIIQILLSLYGFTAIKWVETVASTAIMIALVYVFGILITSYREDLAQNLVQVEGTWGLAFFGFIMVFLGNYAAIFLNSCDYSRELKAGMSDGKRFLLYFTPNTLAYGFVLMVGVMLASVTGITNPAQALPIVLDNPYFTVVISVFIILAVIATNMIANIVPPAYVFTLLTKAKYKISVTVVGLLAIASFPWILVKEDNARGLDLFILIYSAFLGPIIAILLVEYYILRKRTVNITELYDEDGMFVGYNECALIALFIGAGAAFIQVDLAWILGLITSGISYLLLMKFAFKNSKFKKGTICEE